MISVVLSIFIHYGTLFCCRQSSSCLEILPVRGAKFLSECPWTPSAPGAFQLDVLFNWTRMFYGVIEIDTLLSTSPSCSFSCDNQSTSLLCSLVSPHILLQNVTLSLAPGAGSFPLAFRQAPQTNAFDNCTVKQPVLPELFYPIFISPSLCSFCINSLL